MISPERIQELPLTAEERARYARHMTLPQVGIDGQRKLKAARVLCIGAGGLGSPVTMHLAAAGVGTLGVVDPDRVEASNLHRQLLHGADDIGRPKVDSAVDTLRAINPHVTVQQYPVAFQARNAMALADGYDLIVDGTDNFPTRYLSNDVAFFLKIPNVYGSIYQFEGQVSVFAPHLGGPCYRCMFPKPPKPGLVPSCAEGGVFGVLPGIIGALQATEAIKLILGVGTPLLGQLVHIDTLSMKTRSFQLRRDPECPLCGEHRVITELVDYEAFCGVPKMEAEEVAVAEISPQTLKAKLESDESFTLIDVREPFERDICCIPGAISMPLGTLPGSLGTLQKSDAFVLHCKLGGRSEKAARVLLDAGFQNVCHLAGGIMAWAEEIDPELKRY